MQTTKQYLQQRVGPCIKELFAHYISSQQFKSVYDLFNAQKFHKFLTCVVLQEDIKNKISDTELLTQAQSHQSYNQMRKKNFMRIYGMIQNSFDLLGMEMKQELKEKDIEKMIETHDLRAMTVMTSYAFELLKENKPMISSIMTTLDENTQILMAEVMQHLAYDTVDDHRSSEHSYSSTNLSSKVKFDQNDPNSRMIQLEMMENHIHQMEMSLQVKDEEMRELKLLKEQLEEQLEEARKEMEAKHEEVQGYKKRLVSYQQIDQLLQEKDEEILKLGQRLRQHELKSRVRESQLMLQNKHLHQRLSQFEAKDTELVAKYQKQKHIISQLNKQKEELQTSLKKVIANLKDKNKSLADKINELQKELLQANFQKEMKDKQIAILKQGIKEGSHTIGKPVSIYDIGSPRSPLRNDDFAQGPDSLRGNYSKLGEQLSIDLDRADFQDDLGIVSKQDTKNSKFQDLLLENNFLKQQLQKNLTSNEQFKELQDEIQKMKKRVVILKRRNDQLQNQRKDEIDIMISAMEEWYAVGFPALNPSKTSK